MQNIDFIMNPSISPVYIISTNMVMPILTITNKAISSIILTIVSRSASIIVELMIIMKAFKYFILRELSNIYLDGFKLFVIGIMIFTVGLMFAVKIVILQIIHLFIEFGQMVSKYRLLNAFSRRQVNVFGQIQTILGNGGL